MSAQHTPGPWSVPHFAEPEVNCECGYVLTESHMGAVCTVHASGDGDWRLTGDNPKFAEAVANARLIAAAPDLATELRDLVDWLEANQRTIEGMFSMDDLLSGPRAALSKALGQGEGQ